MMLYNTTYAFVCVDKSWFQLNGDGSPTGALKTAITNAGGDWHSVRMEPYTEASLSYQQSDQPPFVTSGPDFSIPFLHPLAELQPGTPLNPGQYIRISLLSPLQTYFAYHFTGAADSYQYFNTRPYEAIQEEVTYSKDALFTTYPDTTSLLTLKSDYHLFGYQYWGSDCQDTDYPTSYGLMGADNQPYPLTKMVAAKIDF